MLDRGVTIAASIAVLTADAQRCRAGRFLFYGISMSDFQFLGNPMFIKT